jgi:hypothetical protein
MISPSRQHLNHGESFDAVFGPTRGRKTEAAPEDTPPCSECHEGLASSGYHGPPGDDRGSIPCPRCQAQAFEKFVLSGGDCMRGTTIDKVLALLHDTPNPHTPPLTR